MQKRKKSLLISLVLGDGHIAKSGKGNCLQITHSIKQKEYFEWKRQLIADLLDCNLPGVYHREDSRHNEFSLNKSHRYFRIIRKWLYKNGIKRFNKKILDYITAEGLAIWFMDDGSHCVNRRKSTGKVMSHTFKLYTFTNEEDTDNIIQMFKEKFGINVYKLKYIKKDGSLSYYLQWKTREGRKFCNLIRPYVIPSMQYKLLQPGE